MEDTDRPSSPNALQNQGTKYVDLQTKRQNPFFAITFLKQLICAFSETAIFSNVWLDLGTKTAWLKLERDCSHC